GHCGGQMLGVRMVDVDSAQASTERLALLCRLSQTFNSTLDLDEVLNRVMDEVIAATGAERGFVMLREASGALVFRVARGIDRDTIDDPQFQVSRGVVDWVAGERQPVLTSDAQADDRFSMRRSILDLGLRSILCVPLTIKDRVLGVVYVDNRLQAGIFGPADLDLLAAIASSAAIAIENARLYQVAVEKGRLEREFQMARELQASLLPRHTPKIPGWEFAARWLPAREVAGDYYDLIPLADGRLALVIADVCDKGMASALFMALSRSIVRASLDGAPSPVEGITRANRLICADARGGLFVTLFCALLELETGRVTYVNAGHNPPLLFKTGAARGERPARLMPTGMALGVVVEFPFEQRTLQLDSGDWLLLYTDGAIDAMDAQGASFGQGRLEHVLMEHSQRSAKGILGALEAAIQGFTGSMAQFDDIAFLVVRKRQACLDPTSGP
ncbi:MAG: PP2C family protein-serine/threonine phosphatase, partial [Anaerolineae bacterium]